MSLQMRTVSWTIEATELASRREQVTLLDLRPAEDFAVGHIEGSRHVDLYGISLSDTSEAPLAAFLSIFQTLLGRGLRP
jgi:rhodanese-related sulfurtransferase